MDQPLVGSEIHGFHTMLDLDMTTTYVEAASRWLRPNEIQAILCNHKYFTIHVKPMHLPKSGTVVLFDRKMLRNFRKDGHNWKKKKDGKTVKEAHEHLKVGNEERIHVYYAHGQDNSTFVRRCYWLLDKSLEHIVLVHYRETQEAAQGSPATPVNSNSTSNSASDPPLAVLDEFDSGPNNAYYDGGQQSESGTASTHQQSLYDINTLEWDDLLVTNDLSNSDPSSEGTVFLSGGAGNLSLGSLVAPAATSGDSCGDLLNNVYVPAMEGQPNSSFQQSDSVGVGFGDSSDGLVNKRLQTQDSLGRWIDGILTETPVPTEDSAFGTSNSSSPAMSHTQSLASGHIFSITDVSPEWAFYGEKTKILITGFFHEKCAHHAKSNLLCVCGDACISAELVQLGVYRCMVLPNSHGLVNLFLSLDGQKAISQVLSFECRRPPVASNAGMLSEDDQRWQELRIQMRLAHLLFASYKSLNILSGKVSPISLSTAKKFVNKASAESPWLSFLKSVDSGKTQFHQAKDNIFRLVLRDRLKEWIVERLVDGSKSTEFDVHGQGVIHLFAILGYTWAIRMFSLSGLSLDFRDKRGWTALHWAACCGNEKMVAALLSLGAKPNLITDPTAGNPGGFSVGDIASMHGYDGLAAYLSEKALIEHLNQMSLAGNASGRIDTSTTTAESSNLKNLTEEELYMKDSLAAYRTAADAAARIHVAFREHSLKVRTKVVEVSNPEEEARTIVAAMKIQQAFRNFDTRKKMHAAVQIQHRYRTWKMRRDFLKLRRHTVKIQAIFRGFQMRRQYRKIIWSVGVVEKAILRWRLKRKGFRGLQVNPEESMEELSKGSDTEEDFYRTSQKQAEQRVERSVVRVQALFRSKKAQEEYQIMKLAHKQAALDYNDLLDPDIEMR